MIFKIKHGLVKKPWGIKDVESLTGINPSKQDAYGKDCKYGEIYIAGANNDEKLSGEDGARPNEIIGKNLDLYEILKKHPELLGKARKTDGPSGKTESWYFRKVVGSVSIAVLKKHIDRSIFKELIDSSYFRSKPGIDDLKESLIDLFKVNEAESYLIRPGTLHSIVPDKDSFAVVDEVQQGYGDNMLPTLSKILMVSDMLSLQLHPSDEDVKASQGHRLYHQFLSDPSIRVYDFARGRKDHLEESLDFIDFGCIIQRQDNKFETTKMNGTMIKPLIRCEYFCKDLVTITSDSKILHDDQYYVYQVIEGECLIKDIKSNEMKQKNNDMKLSKGDILFVSSDEMLDIRTRGVRFLRDYKNRTKHG